MGDVEVNQFNNGGVIERAEKVFRLDIAVYEPTIVYVLQSRKLLTQKDRIWS